MKKQKLFNKNTIIISIVSLLFIILIISLAYSDINKFEKIFISQAQQNLLMIAKTTAGRLEEYIVSHSKALKALSMNPLTQEEIYNRTIKKDIDTEYCRTKTIYEIHKDDMDALIILDSNGMILHSHPFVQNESGKDYTDKPSIMHIIREHKPYISETFYDNLGHPYISISEPVFYKDKFAGIVQWMVQLDTIYKRFVKPIKLGMETCKWLIDEDGVLLGHGSWEEIGQNFIKEKIKKMPDHDWSALDKIVKKAMQGEEGQGLFVCPNHGKKIVAYTPVHIGDRRWTLGMNINYSEIASPIKKHEKNVFGLAGLIILCFGVGGIAFFRTQQKKAELNAETKHLKHIVKSTEALRKSEKKLAKYRNHLENLVEKRTVDINKTNVKLQLEIEERKRTEDELKQSREQLRDLASHLQTIREEEGSLIAREIHDELGQALTALKMDIHWLSNRLPMDQQLLLEKTKLMSKLIDMTVQSVQRISSELRPGLLDDLGLSAAIEWQANEFRSRTNIQCKIISDPEDIILDRNSSTAIFRIFQETLTNIARHANATRVEVTLKQKSDTVELTVYDNGRGITENEISDPKSFGLIGMRERVHSLCGYLTIKGSQNKGTIVKVFIATDKEKENR